MLYYILILYLSSGPMQVLLNFCQLKAVIYEIYITTYGYTDLY